MREGADSEDGRGLAMAGGLAAILAVAMDYWLVARGDGAYLGPRAVLVATALAASLVPTAWGSDSAGCRLRPAQGIRYWVGTTIGIGAAVGGLVLCAGAALWLLGRPPTIAPIRPEDRAADLIRLGLLAPLFEEPIYRACLCTGLAPLIGRRWTVVMSGLAFGALHVVYGNPAPDNLVAGFFLAWAYLKSESLVVPVALHALGNLVVFAVRSAVWYWTG